jgi:lipid A 3-O-deacylase
MSFRSGRRSAYLTSLVAAIVLLSSTSAQAERSLGDSLWNVLRGRTPHERAWAVYGGTTYDWSDMSFGLVSWQGLYDYSKFWPQPAPDRLKMRLETNIGAATGTDFSGQRLIASANFLAVYEFGSPKSDEIVPYIEGGSGVIYTDFQRPDQGLRWNFNPMAGIGIRMGSKFLVLRLHHVSNAGLDDENRGINSVLLGFGVYLGSNW